MTLVACKPIVTVALATALSVTTAWGDYSVQVDIRNVSGEAKADWPVVLKVYTVLGRNLPAGSVRPEGFHVYDDGGKEVPHAVEQLPPYDQPGNDELVFVIPRIAPGQTLSYRVANTAAKSDRLVKIDLAGSPHNLLANGDFERAEAGTAPVGWGGQGSLDAKVAHGGTSSLVLAAEGGDAAVKHAKPVGLHRGSWYYFGVWSKTDRVGRFGYQAGPGAHFRFNYLRPSSPDKQAAALGQVMPQCSARDWLKCTFEGGRTDWGLERYVAQATADEANVEFVLHQPRHYYMPDGQTRGQWWLDGATLIEQPEVNVRFDLALEKQLADGVFLFTRVPEMPLGKLQETDRKNIYKRLPPAEFRTLWCQMPFAHEKLTALDRAVARGQRASFCVGLYHTRAVKQVVVRPAGMALAGPEGAKLPVETVEYCPGYLGLVEQAPAVATGVEPPAEAKAQWDAADKAMGVAPALGAPSRYMPVVKAEADTDVRPVDPDGARGVRYFFLTFLAPRDAKPGKYVGQVEVLAGGKLLASVPVSLRVQDLLQPVLRDTHVGLIYNGDLPDIDDMLRQYARSGFSQIMWFHGWVPYAKGPDGKQHVDAEKLAPKMKMLLDLGITAGCGIYTEVQLDNKPAGHMGRMAGIAHAEARAEAKADKGPEYDQAFKAAYARLITELQAAAAAHPEWPRFIHMNWDEPPPSGAKMGWTNEILGPGAITTLDTQFDPLPKVMQYYNTPAFDDPADWAGPEIYDFCRRNGKSFGFCGATDTAEPDRYQPGMMMIASGAVYFHAWHIRGGHTPGQMAWDAAAKRTIRGPEMICWAGGMDDLKAHRLLLDALAAAKQAGRNPPAVQAAEGYLAKVRAVFNGDHRKTWSLQPYLGTAWSWGYERFYDDWQEQLLKHAAAVQGVRWVE